MAFKQTFRRFRAFAKPANCARPRHMTKLLKAGVVGSGVFGGYHARKYAEMDGIELVGIYDLHPERCFDMANQYGAEAYGDLGDMLKVVDIVTVATPATTLYAAAYDGAGGAVSETFDLVGGRLGGLQGFDSADMLFSPPLA